MKHTTRGKLAAATFLTMASMMSGKTLDQMIDEAIMEGDAEIQHGRDRVSPATVVTGKSPSDDSGNSGSIPGASTNYCRDCGFTLLHSRSVIDSTRCRDCVKDDVANNRSRS